MASLLIKRLIAYADGKSMILFNNEMYTVSVSEIVGLFYNQQCRFIQFKPLGKLLDHIIIAYTLKWFVYFRVVILSGVASPTI